MLLVNGVTGVPLKRGVRRHTLMLCVSIGLLLATASPSPAQVPTFPQFPATVQFTGVAAKPNLSSHPNARRYRTVLRNTAPAGPDFAGAYTFVRIGCGTGCIEVAILDARNGAVFFPKALPQINCAGWWHDPYGPQYRRDSRLLIVSGQAGDAESPFGVSYFEWTGTDFRLLRFELQDRGAPPTQ
jgi:hypothetical protein